LKKITAILLLSALCFNGMGYYFMHRHLQKQIRKEIKGRIKQQVPQEELVTLIQTSENAGEFSWIHSKEFRYKGTMYDIVSLEKVSETRFIYHCVTDHQETLLFKNLSKYVNNTMNANPANSKANNLLSSLFSSLYPPESINRKQIFVSEEIHWIDYTPDYKSPFLKVSFLPPKA